MKVPPLSERPVTEEEEQVFLALPSHRKERFIVDTRTALRPWVIDIGLTVLMAVACVVAYRLVAGIGSWSENPSAATTPTVHPAPAPTVSSKPAMSGRCEIGPGGVLVRSAEFTTDTYTKSKLPKAAKENSERGAEAAAEHYLALMVYAWNTGDTMLLEDMSTGDSQFAREVMQRINALYGKGWLYNNLSSVEHVLKLEPAGSSDGEEDSNAAAVVFAISLADGTICRKKSIFVREQPYHSIFALVMTWEDGRWVVTRAGMEKAND